MADNKIGKGAPAKGAPAAKGGKSAAKTEAKSGRPTEREPAALASAESLVAPKDYLPRLRKALRRGRCGRR